MNATVGSQTPPDRLELLARLIGPPVAPVVAEGHAYGYAKEQKWTRLGIGQAAVREMAHEHAMMLLAEAAFLFRLLKSSEPDAAATPDGSGPA